MSTSKHSWVEVLGIFGVIAGLAFVGFELKQSRDIAVAQMYQDRAALDIQIRTYFAPSEAVYSAFTKFQDGKELTAQERTSIERAFGNILIYWESNHQLYEMGMLDEEHWTASIESMNLISKHPLFISLWNAEKDSYRTTFREIVNAQISQ
ncbi:MAG: hypothetical protein GKR90_17575 [Pseudomonadales bacterium]|nr:hypothetical protein [Pseudomonadales bacterium]